MVGICHGVLFTLLKFANMNILSQYRTIAAVLSALVCCNASAITGPWRGNLEFGQTKIPLVFNFSETDQGKTSCTLDSPSQGVKGISADVTFCSDDSIALECKSIGATFRGNVASDSISGKFTQRGMTFPLLLKPDAPLEDRRPQTPRPPFPYTVIDTVFTSTDGTLLSGTMTLPADTKSKKIPAIVMVTGSGPQNRDEEMLDHKPFAVIADYLARNGVASLRYDDRGTGESKGDFLKATTYTFKDDAKSGMEFLKKMKGIGKIGLLGHSEGGTIAFMLAAEKVPDFIISLAGLAESGKEGLLKQNELILDQSGITGETKENCMTLISRLFDIQIEQNKSGVCKPIDIDSLAKATGKVVPPSIITSLKSTQKIRTPWFDTLITINPQTFLSKIKCPVLAINGDKDTQVEAGANIGIIKKNIPKAETHVMPGLNHLMQHCETGEMAEYDSIRETISPEVLDLILSFILRR